MSEQRPSDLELLRVEVETLWARDARGRLLRDREPSGCAAPHLVIACAADGYAVEIGSAVPDAVAAELLSAIERTPPAGDPAIAPVALDRCIELIERAIGAVEVASGPGYVIPPGTSFASDVPLVRSGDAGVAWLREGVPEEANWRDDDWRALIDGKLGPWACAVVDGGVVSTCHCARLWERGAEAGVWTHPEHRGRGYAAAVTAAWASLAAAEGRTLFYSTSATNFSSQRVAARLGLRRIGWFWQVRGSLEF